MAGESNPDSIASSAAAAGRGARVGTWPLVLLASMLAACSVKPAGDHAAPDEEWTGELLEPLCSPKLTRYPVAGPHNGGYDKNALNYTCHPHPGSSPDGSDFIPGDHYGNDIFAAKGTPMVAPVSGTVVTAGTNTLGGWVVKIRDGCNWDYYLAHLDYIQSGIKVDMKINAGQKIGAVGNSGNASGTSPHLHFSVFPAGNYNAGIDPFPLLQQVDATACGGGCKRHCEGDTIVDENCGKGNCAAYGASCVDDAKGVRCVVFYCADNPTQAHDVCLLNGNRGHCDAKGAYTDLGPCPGGTSCKNGKCVAPGGGGSGGGASSGGASTGGSAGTSGTTLGGAGGETGAPGSGGTAGVWGQAGDSSIPLGGSGGVDSSGATPNEDVEGGVGCSVSRRAHEHGGAPLALLLASLGLWRSRRRLGNST